MLNKTFGSKPKAKQPEVAEEVIKEGEEEENPLLNDTVEEKENKGSIEAEENVVEEQVSILYFSFSLCYSFCVILIPYLVLLSVYKLHFVEVHLKEFKIEIHFKINDYLQ